MKTDIRLINSKIGRRIFLLFALCALLPILTLVVVSYSQVSAQIEQQAYLRLQKEAKSHSLSIYERLVFLESELRLRALSVTSRSGASPVSERSGRGLHLPRRFLSFFVLEEASGSYFQLAPGILATGEDERVDLKPGALLEAELGNRWVALTTGLHVQPWTHDRFGDPAAHDVDVMWTLGGRVHGAIGLGTIAVLYLSLAIAFASSSGSWD